MLIRFRNDPFQTFASGLSPRVGLLVAVLLYAIPNVAFASPRVDGALEARTESVESGPLDRNRANEVPEEERTPDWGKPLIPKGMEERVIGFIQPYAMGDSLHGVSIGDIHIGRDDIRYNLVGENGTAMLVLQHPDFTSEPASHSASFAMIRRCHGECPDEAFAALEAAIRANDDGTLWPRGSARGDGVVHFILGLSILVFVLVRQLRNGPRWVTPALLSILALGSLFRLGLSVEAPMTAWPYERVPPLILAAAQGVVLPWIGREFDLAIGLVDLVFAGNLVLAVLTPLLVFAHARHLLGDHSKALAAALLFAVLPMHIRFSRSDVYMVQSLATASLTFVVIYTSLLDRSRPVRLLFLALIPFLSLATYRIRPENFALALLDLAAVYVVADRGVPLRRQLLVGGVIVGTAVYVFLTEFFVQHQEAVALGLSLDTATSAFRTLINPSLNTFTNPLITPPWLLLLAVLGGIWLWRNGERKRTVFILLWFFGYLFIHSIVEGVPAMQARYHLQLVTPFIMLAAAALPVVLRWDRKWQIALASLLVLSPVLYTGFIRDTNYYEMEEFTFLRQATRDIPDGCTVLEFSPAYSLSRPRDLNSSRLTRFAQQVGFGHLQERFRVVNSGVLYEGEDAERLSSRARSLLESPKGCLIVYEGLTCQSHRPPGSDIAPVCAEVRQMLPGSEMLADTRFKAKVYDHPFLSRLDPGAEEHGIRPGDAVSLRLSRVTIPPRTKEGDGHDSGDVATIDAGPTK